MTDNQGKKPPIAKFDAAEFVEKNIRYLIPAVALLFVILRLFFPDWGKNFDTISLALIAIALLPWLSMFVESFSVAGILEAKLIDLNKQISDVRESQVSSANLSMSLMATPITSNNQSQTASLDGKVSQASQLAKLEDLAVKYVAKRKDLPSGDERSEIMGQVFRDMVAEAKTLTVSTESMVSMLLSDDQGQVLAGIASVFASTSSDCFGPLLTSIENSNQPFIQYWGLRAFKLALDNHGRNLLTPKMISRLSNLKTSFRRGTDRAYVLASINSSFEN